MRLDSGIIEKPQEVIGNFYDPPMDDTGHTNNTGPTS
jgi:hypothetical protein